MAGRGLWISYLFMFINLMQVNWSKVLSQLELSLSQFIPSLLRLVGISLKYSFHKNYILKSTKVMFNQRLTCKWGVKGLVSSKFFLIWKFFFHRRLPFIKWCPWWTFVFNYRFSYIQGYLQLNLSSIRSYSIAVVFNLVNLRQKELDSRDVTYHYRCMVMESFVNLTIMFLIDFLNIFVWKKNITLFQLQCKCNTFF